jgi:hypothetical protein
MTQPAEAGHAALPSAPAGWRRLTTVGPGFLWMVSGSWGRRLVPEENRVAEVLGRLLGGVWGPVGFWFMVLGVFIGFWDTVLSDQDGHGRMFAAGMRLGLERRGVRGRWVDETFLQKAVVVALVTILPIVVYLVAGQPVTLLRRAGAIEAAHIPLVTALVLWLQSPLAAARITTVAVDVRGHGPRGRILCSVRDPLHRRTEVRLDTTVEVRMSRPISFVAVIVAVTTIGAAAAQRTQQQVSQPLPERYTAIALGTGGPLTRGVASNVDITITRWSSDGETERLLTTLKNEGPQKLLDAVRDAKSVGTIQTPGNLAYDLRYAQQEVLGDGLRRIVLITDRPISMWEAVNRPRTIDYPFTLIELRVNSRGEGEGKLNLATRIDISRTGRTLQLENYDSQPIHLNEVRRRAR